MDDQAGVLERGIEAAVRGVGTDRADTLGLQLNHLTSTTPLVYTHYSPSLSFVLTGRKRTVIGECDDVWGPDRFLITPVRLPVIAQVVAVGANRAFVSANWRLDPLVITEVVATMPPRPTDEPTERLGRMTAPLADALARLLRLLDAPEEVALLGPPLAREIVLRLLQTDQAARVLACADVDRTTVVADACRLLEAGLAAGWTPKRLATTVGVTNPRSTVGFVNSPEWGRWPFSNTSGSARHDDDC